jgi:hypothetical protein
MMSFIGGISGPQVAQVLHQVDAIAQHSAEFLAHAVSFLLQGGKHELGPLPGKQEAVARLEVGFFAELCRDGDAAILAKMDVGGGFHGLSIS